jgi:hypothetical protein
MDLVLLIKDGEGEYMEVHAVVDPDCKDNWVSPEIVKSLFIQRDVRHCHMVKARFPFGDLTATQKVILGWRLKKNPESAQVDDFFIFREAIDVDAILGNDTKIRYSRNQGPPRQPRDHDDGTGGSSSITTTTTATARANSPITSNNGVSSSNWPPKPAAHVNQPGTFPLSSWRLVADHIVDGTKV